MSRRTAHLQLRGSIYHFRLRVPAALQAAVGKTEITKSLDTGDRDEARQLARLERVKIDAEWARLRRKLSLQAPAAPAEIDVWRLVSRWFVDAEKRREKQPINAGELSFEDASFELGCLYDWEESKYSIQAAAKRLLEDEGLQVPDRQQLHALHLGIQSAMIEVEKRDLSQMFPQRHLALDLKFRALDAHTALKKSGDATLSQVMDAFKADPSRPPLRAKTLVKRDAQWRVLREFFGAATKMDMIDRSRVTEFMTLLEHLPSNASKHFPKASLEDAVTLGERTKLPKLSPDTANTYMRQLGSLFRYAIEEGLATADPTRGKLFAKTKVKPKDKRHPFDIADLKAIFSAPLYAGCVDDEYGYARPGPARPRRGRFWVPLISLFTGMRLGEICQLTLDDVVQQDGADIILIRGEDDETKRVKTEAGERFVPIHSELRRIGFLTYVAARRATDEPSARLFPELPTGSTGYLSDPFSKFYARFLDKVGINDRKKVFHSFRHTYRDALREADISAERVRALGGWTSNNTEDVYGKGLRPSTLAKEIEKVSYTDLDLSHLYGNVKA